MQPSQDEKARKFAALHEGAPFLIPNPGDIGSARLLAALGFESLATTSSGFAFTLGRLDGNVSLDEISTHVRALAEATPLPISVDLENGYGPRPEDAALAISRAAEAGAVGGSIEDYGREDGLYEPGFAAERIAAAAEAAAQLDFPFTLTARAENHIRGNPDLEDTVARLQTYERAGADVVYAPGLRSPEEIRAVCEAMTKPVNVIGFGGISLGEIVEAGAQRISVGGGLAFAAADAFVGAAEAIRDHGDFASLGTSKRVKELLGG